jgi:thioredoxin-related protein
MVFSKTSSGTASCTVTLLVLVGAGPLMAQEVQWRQAYVPARREARDKNRPMVFDFGTSNCLWCKKLDDVTFRDPAVISQLNDKFIPVKVEAEKAQQLVEILEIQSFPTLLFAAPDGKILGIHEGFVDALQFNQQMQRALRESREWVEKEIDRHAAPQPTIRGQWP